MRTRAQVRALFGELELIPPWKHAQERIVAVDRWLGSDVALPQGTAALERPGGETLWCGVGRKAP